LGLHPDVIPALGDLLREAATRSQIIVTTHSDVLVDAMSETPESVVVCSKENGQSVMQRLDTADLHIWLEKYRLGQLWTEGKIGGNRW
jgi:predicted ATPase